MVIKAASLILLFACSVALADETQQGKVWRIEGHGSTLFILGESHYAAGKDPAWINEIARALSAEADSILLEGFDPADDFPFLRANCTEATVWSGQLQRQVEYVERALADINSLSAHISPVIESMPVGLMTWAIPSAMSRSGSSFKKSRAFEMVDSRIVAAQDAGRQSKNKQRLVYLDQRRNRVADICNIPGHLRERFFTKLYTSELRKVLLVKAYDVDSVATINAMNAEGVKQAGFLGRAAIGRWPIHISNLTTAFENPTEEPDLYVQKIGRTEFSVILTRRNEAWVDVIDRQMQKGAGVSVSFVGIAHLPSFFDGANIYPGILELISKRGFVVLPVGNLLEVALTLNFDVNSIEALHTAEPLQ